MKPEIIRADPAGNITIFILNPPEGVKNRLEMTKIFMTDPDLKAEQIGFVLPPRNSGDLWRLEMAGGEFCGNASRSLGLLAALKSGLRGRHIIMIQTSGISEPVPVHIDTEAQTAEIVIPGPVSQTDIFLEGRHFPVYEFEGITHIIAVDIQADEQFVRSLVRRYGENHGVLGVMFYNSQKNFMRPAVWVRKTDTLIFESSCGSGSAALGVWAVRDESDVELDIELAQPGGTITVKVVKQAGKVIRLCIGGKIGLGTVSKDRFYKSDSDKAQKN